MKIRFRKLFSILFCFLIINSSFSFPEKAFANNGNFNLTLTTADGNRPIPNAEFVLRKADGSNTFYTRRTDGNGRFSISNIPEGNYILVQNSTINGYNVSKKLDVKIISGQTTNMTVKNAKKGTITSGFLPPKDSTVLRLKVLSSTDKTTPIPNASFLIRGNGIRQVITTDSNGYATLSGLHSGNYTVTQISSPEGFLSQPNDTVVNIPDPIPQQYAEFADIQVFNQPYDSANWGVLNIITAEDGTNGNKRIPNVKVMVYDDEGNRWTGYTNERGELKFKGLSALKTYRAELIEVPYEYESNNTLVQGNIRLTVGNTQTQTFHIPKSPTGLLTINNYEKGDFNVKISGSRFRLIHPDGSSREFEIQNGTHTIQLPQKVDQGEYRLIQIHSDANHNIYEEEIPFTMSRPVELNVPNKLKNPNNAKTSLTFEKVWGDVPTSNVSATVKLLADGVEVGNGKEFTVNSRDGNVTRTFSDLPKYDADHESITYTVKENPINEWYAEYEEVTDGRWKITNYEGSIGNTCIIDPARPIIFYSTANTAYMTENANTLKKTLTFTGTDGYDQSFGHGIAYDKVNGNLYGVNRQGYLAVNDVYKGNNGRVTKIVKLKELFDDAQKSRVDGKFINPDFRKVNTLETSIDEKYIIGRSLADTNIYLYRISDILKANNGADVTAARVIASKHAVATRSNTPVADGDIIQYHNGDILYTGHENRFFEGTLAAPQRSNYNFWLLKYEGQRDSSGKPIDIATGTFSAPIKVGSLTNPAEANSSRDGQSANFEHAIEGLVFARNTVWFTSSIVHNGKIIEWNLGQIIGSANRGSRLPDRNSNPDNSFNFSLYSLKNTGDTLGRRGFRSEAEVNRLFGGKGNLVTRINDLNSIFADMTGADSEHCSPVINVRGKKSWVNDDESTRPNSITVRLYKDGQRTDSTAELNAGNNWAYVFPNLPKNDGNRRINYTVREENTPNGYYVTNQDYSIINTLLKGKFSIKKTNENRNQALSGATFSLWNEDKSKQIIAGKISDNNGVINFDGLTAGTYYLIEDDAPDGYTITNKEYKVVGTVNQQTRKVDFVVSYNNNAQPKDGDHYVITNHKPKYKIKVVKVDAGTGEKITETSRFAIENEAGQTINGQVANLSNGEFVFDNRQNKFEPGVYYLKEVTAPSGYVALTERIKFTIHSDGSASVEPEQAQHVGINGINITRSDVIELRVNNPKEERRFNLHLKKRDKDEVDRITHSDNSDIYDGNLRKLVATFRLEKKVVDGNSERYENVNLPNGGVTNINNGYLSIQNLTQGEYKLTETQAPNGYNLTIPITFTVTKNGVEVPQGQDNSRIFFHNGNSSNELVVVVKNEIKKYPITIRKLKATREGTITENTLVGARLKLKAEAGTKAPEFNTLEWHRQHYGANIELDGALTWNSSAAGDAVFNLSPGTYKLSEISTLAGFKLLEDEITIIVKNNGELKIRKGRGTEELNLIRENNSNIEIAKTGTKDGRNTINLANHLEIYLRATKKELEKNTLVRGAVFELFTDANARTKIAESTATGTDGRARFKNIGTAVDYKLKEGTYYIKEKSVPNDYLLNTKIYQINIDSNGNVTSPNADEYFSIGRIGNDKNNTGDYKVLDITFNNKKYHNLTFQKIDSSKKGQLDSNQENKDKALSGAKIKIRPKTNDGNTKIKFDNDNWNRTNMNGEYSEADGGVIWRSNTREMPGFHITPGTYIVEELEAPEGFTKFNPFEIQIDKDGTPTIQSNTNGNDNVKIGIINRRAVIQAVNKKNTFDITFRKIDDLKTNRNEANLGLSTTDDNEEKALTNAKIEIRTKENDPTARIKFDNLDWHRSNMQGEQITEGNITKVVFKMLGNNKPGLKVTPGTYIVKELEAPFGYKKFQEFEFIVNEEGTVRLGNNPNGTDILVGREGTDRNKGNTNRFMLNAVDKFGFNFTVKKVDTNGNFLNGSRFSLRKATSSGVIHEGQVANITTQDGFTFNVRGRGFQPGIYYLVEDTVPNGYQGIEPLKIEITESGVLKIADENFTENKKFGEVTVEKSNTESNQITFKVENKKKITLHIKKRDKKEVDAFRETNNSSDFDANFTKLVARFTLKKKEAEGENYVAIPNYENIETNQEGYLNIPNLLEGEYELIESQSPIGYNELTETIKFRITRTGYEVTQGANNARIFFHNSNNSDLVAVVKNEKIKYDIKIIKTNNKNIEDERFELLANSRFKISKDAQGNIEAEEKIILNKLFTLREDGRINSSEGVTNYWEDAFNTDRHNNWSGYELGLYYLTETQAPNGYKAIEGAVPFYINPNGTVTIPAKIQNGAVVLENGIAEKDTSSKYADFFEADVRDGYKWSPKKLIVIKAKNEKEKTPLKLYIDKKNEAKNRITTGNLTIKLKDANIFNQIGTTEKIDEKTFNLERDYEADKGLKIEIPTTLITGEYILTEKTAPIGYTKTNTRYHIQINQEDRTIKLIKTDTGEGTQETQINKTLYEENQTNTTETINILEIINKQKEYPMTGGIGEILYTLIGLIIMIIGIHQRKKQHN